MLVQFVGGPYDGMTRAPAEDRDVIAFFDVPTKRGRRRFAMLPALADWPSVAGGSTRLRDSRYFYFYELTVVGRSSIFLYDHDARRYKEAIFDSL